MNAYSEITLTIRVRENKKRRYSFPLLDFSAIVTHVPVSASEFEAYNLGEESDITFCQKDIRVGVSIDSVVNLFRRP